MYSLLLQNISINDEYKVFRVYTYCNIVKLNDIVTINDHIDDFKIIEIYFLKERIGVNSYYPGIEVFPIVEIKTINKKEIEYKIKEEIINNIKKEEIMETTNKKSMFNSIIEKYKSQFIPVIDNELKLSIDGNICVKIGDEYIGIDKDNNLVSYPIDMHLDMPIYIMQKSYEDVKVGDIIKMNKSYGKVLNKNKNGTLQCLSFSGYTHNKREIKDFILNKSLVSVVINIFNETQINGFNPMMLMMMNEDTNIKDIMLMQMMGNQQFNPMMLMMMKDNDKDNSLIETMLMMQMINGNMPDLFNK